MSPCFYKAIAPDYLDMGSKVANRSGHLIEIVESDGGIGLALCVCEEEADNGFAIFLNVQEAEEVATALRAAIDHARSKDVYHKPRVLPLMPLASEV